TIVFFFQAEDGIRDRNVTGVQTCALPISDRAEDASASRVSAVLDEHARVLIETDVGTVGPATLLGGAHDNGLDDVALLDSSARHGVLHRGDDGVTDPGIASTRAPENTDGQDLLGTRVVGDLESRLLLNHVCS